MPNLDFLDVLGDAMGEVYAACHDRLLENLARYFRELKPGENPGGAFQYQARRCLGLNHRFKPRQFGPIGRTDKPLRKYRTIKVVKWRVNFSTGDLADFAGLLAVNQESCKWRMSEKAPPDVPPYCAVLP